MQWLRTATPSLTAGQQLTQILERYRDTPTLLLVSGGSALTLLEHVDPDVLGTQLTLGVLDERFSTDRSVNNFAQIQSLPLYARACAQGVQCIDTTVSEHETLQVVEERFEKALRAWRSAYPDGVVVATMGVGEDGHTAGIFSGAQSVDFADKAWVAAYAVPSSVNQFTERITVTYTFLRTQVTEALVYAVGMNKKAIVTKLEAGCTLEQLPICVVHEMHSVTVVTDQ